MSELERTAAAAMMLTFMILEQRLKRRDSIQFNSLKRSVGRYIRDGLEENNDDDEKIKQTKKKLLIYYDALKGRNDLLEKCNKPVSSRKLAESSSPTTLYLLEYELDLLNSEKKEPTYIVRF